MGVAFLYYWPVMLALVSRAAPAKVNATMMGGAFLALFVGSVTMGWIGSYYGADAPGRLLGDRRRDRPGRRPDRARHRPAAGRGLAPA